VQGTKTTLTCRFGNHMVSSTIETLIVSAPKSSSSGLTMMRGSAIVRGSSRQAVVARRVSQLQRGRWGAFPCATQS
jgi:hypothetical protein